MTHAKIEELDEFIHKLKTKAISSNEVEFLFDISDVPDNILAPCARSRPKDLKRYVQMKQDLIDNIEGPFLYTKHSWASIINTPSSILETRAFEYPQLPNAKEISSIEDRIGTLENHCFDFNNLCRPDSITIRISKLLCKLKDIKTKYFIPDDISVALNFNDDQLTLSTQNITNFKQILLISLMEKFILEVKLRFPYIYYNEFFLNS